MQRIHLPFLLCVVAACADPTNPDDRLGVLESSLAALQDEVAALGDDVAAYVSLQPVTTDRWTTCTLEGPQNSVRVYVALGVDEHGVVVARAGSDGRLLAPNPVPVACDAYYPGGFPLLVTDSAGRLFGAEEVEDPTGTESAEVEWFRLR